MNFKSADHPVMRAIAWHPEQPAERINDHILMSRGTSNAYLVESTDGDVVINTGMAGEGARHRDRFEQLLGRKLKVARIIFTQSHADHIGGWEFFADEGAETIAQRMFGQLVQERNLLAPFFYPRMKNVIGAMLTATATAAPLRSREPEGLTLFSESHAFEQGGRRYELVSIPSGETLDSLYVWIPAERTLFVGNWMGALYGALPNFYTLRGDRHRSVTGFLSDLDKMLALRPRLLITGHEDAVEGEERIAAELGRLRGAVAHIHDETVRGMLAGKPLWQIMRDVALPDHLRMKPGRGPVAWYARAVWEEYAGWFRHERTTELYGTSAENIWPELTEMAGGASALAARAQAHVEAGRPLDAMHFVEMALNAEPANRDALKAKLAALNLLIASNGGAHFDELGWLETQVERTNAALDDM